MRLIAGLLIISGLAMVIVSLAGIRHVDATLHAARSAVQTTGNFTPNTKADINARIVKLEHGRKIADSAAAQMKTNKMIFMFGWVGLAGGISILLMPSLLRFVNSSGLTGTGLGGRR